MREQSALLRLRKFERDWYRGALETLKGNLNDLAAKYEDKPHNDAWLVAYESLLRHRLAVAAAKAGLLTDVFEEEES